MVIDTGIIKGKLNMVTMDLCPTTTSCIESTARSFYNELVSRYLRDSAVTEELEEKIELITSFLQIADFKKLRRESEPYLLQDKKVIFTIYNDGTGVRYSMKIF